MLLPFLPPSFPPIHPPILLIVLSLTLRLSPRLPSHPLCPLLRSLSLPPSFPFFLPPCFLLPVSFSLPPSPPLLPSFPVFFLFLLFIFPSLPLTLPISLFSFLLSPFSFLTSLPSSPFSFLPSPSPLFPASFLNSSLSFPPSLHSFLFPLLPSLPSIPSFLPSLFLSLSNPSFPLSLSPFFPHSLSHFLYLFPSLSPCLLSLSPLSSPLLSLSLPPSPLLLFPCSLPLPLSPSLPAPTALPASAAATAPPQVTWVHSLANRLVALNGVVVVADARLGLAEVNGSPALEISDVQKKDEGLYKCFSSGTVSYELFVVEPVLEVGVPATAARFTNQTLTCAYRGGEGVARLEWLLDGAPFFHYNPFRNAQVSTVFNTNVEVIREASTPQRLVLREVDVTAAGVYTCQVLLAASGRLLSDSAEMVVEGVQEPERARPPPLRIESYGVVAATAGEEAALGCRVFPSESATVSWKRLRDQKLLSTNNYSYTGDVEHRVRHEEGSSEWHLWLAQVAPEDDRFECRAVGVSGGEVAAVVRLTFEEEEKVGVSAVRVPSRATRFTDQTLTCSYNLGDMGLYAVKWYLNDSEFFRYSSERDIVVFGQDVQVNIEESGANKVVLREVDFSASGTYRCEVISDAPYFKIFVGSSTMTVIAEEEKVGVSAVRVPSRATRFTDQTLTCSYNLGDMGLYAVKWYLNDSEFFRYSSERDIVVFGQDVQVNIEESGANKVVLREVDFSASGTYRCEVISDAPYFKIFVGSSTMTVIAEEEKVGVSAVRVPSRATRFTDQTLTCSYNLGDMGLYAVKWYLNDSEFFRYSSERDIVVFGQDVQVNIEESGANKVVLREVDFSASGTYRCEVISDAPYFKIFVGSSTMTVIEEEKVGVSAVRVPSRATRFTDQTLTCSYNLGDMGLYAVKWYLNDSEFFRYSSERDIVVFGQDVQVNIEESDANKVVLREVDFSASGTYTCEVMIAAPYFKVFSGSSAMTVIEEEKVGVSAVRVPSRATRFTDQTLTCSYNLGDMGLYAVKWYLNDSLFFRYSSDRKIEVSQDVQVDIEKSNATRVVLREVDLSASGTYTCEVTTDRSESSKSSNMTVTDEAAVEARITAATGSSVEFSCEASAEDGRVSWIRERDLHILSVGSLVFTADPRFSVEQDLRTGAWKLRLARVAQADAGDYSCVTSEHDSRPTLYRLVVVDPTIGMEFPDNITVEVGSTAVLSCRVLHLGQGTVSWIRDEDHYVTAGLFTTTSDYRFTPSVEDSNVWQLRIRDARPEDTGAYSCHVSGWTPAARTVWLTVADAPKSQVPASSTPTICPPPFQLISSHVCIMVETMEKRSWFDAQQYCRSQGGDLAKEDDSSYIRIYLEQHFGISGDTWTRWPFWLGGRKEGGAEGVDGWRWADGSHVAAAVWAASEPRQYPRKGVPQGTCLILDGFQAYSASALPCHLRRRFICQAV
ncbi:obscurin isoform X2 [Penaeus vannamei]|uniref:obscurin isoform X2 n=1 Tax=Penaeus vannamei TaxID=6689 RepID=UPI00387F6AC1